MGKQSVLLILLFVILFFGISTQVKSGGAKNEKKTSVEQKSSLSKPDKLLEWMTFMKSESRRYLNEGDVIRAVDFLSRCIDKRWREPSSPEEYERLAWAYVDRAYIYNDRQGDFLAAKEDYLSALKRFEKCEPKEYYLARYVYQPLGNIHTRLGENELAFSILGEFKRISEESESTAGLMNAYNDLACVYVNTGQLDTAIQLMAKGIEIDDSDDFSLSLLYATKSKAEVEAKRFEDASNSVEKCIYHVNGIVNSLDANDYRYTFAKRYKIDALRSQAAILRHSKELSKAHEICAEVVRLTTESYPVNHRDRVRALVELGNSYNELGSKIKAMECYQQSLNSMIDGVDLQDFSANPSKSELVADVVLGEVFNQKGLIAHELFKLTNKKSWIDISVKAYLSYFDWVEVHRSEQFEFDSKLETAKEIHRIGELALEALFEIHEESNDSKWIDSAFVIMDQTKAIVLAEERGFKDLANNNSEMKDLLKKQNGLKFQRSIFKSDIQEAQSEDNSKDILRLKKRLSELDQQSQLLDQEIRALFPSYRTLARSKLKGELLSEFQDKLKRKNAKVLSYFVGDERVYAITGAPTNFAFSSMERNRLSTATVNFFSELNSPNSSKPKIYNRAGKSLFDLLIGKEFNKLGANWVIFADGILNNLPFEALVSDTSAGSNSFRKMKYLVRDHVIHYSPSAFFYANDEVRRSAKKSFLGIAPVFEHSHVYDFLPKSSEEVEIGTVLFSGDELKEDSATKSHFFRDADQYDILHISTHAGTNSGENNDAWMVFSEAKSSDYRLVATELLQLDLPASLVVLNACETGSGTVLKGEGSMSLARGFLDAGSQSTVTNLWRVNHESNTLIMKSFYENLSETQSPSKSLKEAKLSYLSNGEIDEASAHPYYWSAPVLIGTDVSVSVPNSSMWRWIWISLGSILALVIGVLWYRKKRIA